jgi:3'-5' exoribonuclease
MAHREAATIQAIRSGAIGEPVEGTFLILDWQKRRTKDSKLIVNLKLGDRTGTVDGVIWDGEVVPETFSAGKVVNATGHIGSYHGKPQMILRKYQLADASAEDYLAQPEADADQLAAVFEQLAASVRDPHMQRLLEAVFTPERKAQFMEAPGGRVVHHGYRKGLLEHSVSVAQLCEGISAHYPELNRDLLLTGALLHDVGKTEEYTVSLLPEYTPPGRLLGHIALGAEMIGKTIAVLEMTAPFPQELAWMLKHMILSHHGALEYGSPVAPQFPEAIALHMADNLDAKLFAAFRRVTEGNQDSPYFSSYDVIYRQYFFKYRYHTEEV